LSFLLHFCSFKGAEEQSQFKLLINRALRMIDCQLENYDFGDARS